MWTEQGLLRLSILVTCALALAGVIAGLLLGSYSIVFDGVYSLADASMTALAFLVARLIARSGASGPSRLNERFNMGFWHLEPIVLGISGVMLISASTYALLNAVGSLMSGGRPLDFGPAILYAILVVAATVSMAVFARRANRRIGSTFVALDAQAWLISSALTGALLVAFAFGWLIQGTRLEWISPYVDPLALAVICLAVIPVPVPTVRRALADILLVTPADMREQVDVICRGIVAAEGFLGYRAYVARVGRGRQIEIFFLVPPDWPAMKLAEWDRIRDRIGVAIGGEGPDRWLTIVFTTDPEWIE